MKISKEYQFFKDKYGYGIHDLEFGGIIDIEYDGVIFKKDSETWHRLDGPAYIGKNGFSQWFVNDLDVSEPITEWTKEKYIDIDNLTDVDKLLIKLTWADYGK